MTTIGSSLNYPYRCVGCSHEFEVVKSIKDIENIEYCPECKSIGERYIATSQMFYGANDWDTAHFSPALGKTVRNNAEARRLAKHAGMVEVGTESVEKIHNRFDTERQKKSERGYTDLVQSLTSLGEISS